MSRQGRYVIDRVKGWTSKWNLQMPVPPYNDVNYWEGVYRTTKYTDPPFEWGNMSCADFLSHTYRPISIKSIPSLSSIQLPQSKVPYYQLLQQQQQQSLVKQPVQVRRKNQSTMKGGGHVKKHHNIISEDTVQNGQTLIDESNSTVHSSSTSNDDGTITTTLGELLGNIHPHNGDVQESILILGCGTSRFGEELITNHWNGPIIQVDCSSRLIESLCKRYESFISSGKMIVIQDDATMLSAINDNTVHAVFDKGLMDAFFCTDSYTYLTDTLSSVHRVLQPNGAFCSLSLSHPEFLLPKLLPNLFMGQNISNPIIPTQSSSASSSTHQFQTPSMTLPASRYMMQQHHQIRQLWSHIEVRLITDYIYCYRFTKKQRQQHHIAPTSTSPLSY
jgi:ubiquinone/menaquinone biosynthesis C-methylase UbiE